MISDVFNIKFDITCILFQNYNSCICFESLGRLNELEVHHWSVYGVSPCQCPVFITRGTGIYINQFFSYFLLFPPQEEFLHTLVSNFLLHCKYLSVAFIHRSQCGWILHWIWTPLPSFKISLPLFLAVETAGKKIRSQPSFSPSHTFFYLNVFEVLSLELKFSNYILTLIIFWHFFFWDFTHWICIFILSKFQSSIYVNDFPHLPVFFLRNPNYE